MKLSSEFPQLTHTFNFMLGAVRSLREAQALGHRSRARYDEKDRRQHLKQLHRAINAVAQGDTPPSVWVAGFYYNSAIMRIDACHERFLKAMLEAVGVEAKSVRKTRGETDTDALARRLQQSLGLQSPLVRQHLESVRREVNRLKHELFGQEPRHARTRLEVSDIANAEAAIGELLTLMEDDPIRRRLAGRFSGAPPA
jgi:hypothetical protein